MLHQNIGSLIMNKYVLFLCLSVTFKVSKFLSNNLLCYKIIEFILTVCVGDNCKCIANICHKLDNEIIKIEVNKIILITNIN